MVSSPIRFVTCTWALVGILGRGFRFIGEIDDAALVSTALGETAVQQLMNGVVTSTAPWSHVDDGDGIVEPDEYNRIELTLREDVNVVSRDATFPPTVHASAPNGVLLGSSADIHVGQIEAGDSEVRIKVDGGIFADSRVQLDHVPIDHSNITYSYPGQQPRGVEVPAYGDSTGDQLADGLVPANTFGSGDWVGFNELGVNGQQGDDGTPQPELAIDLGGQYNLSSTAITYLAGGSAGVYAPDSLEIRYSTDGGSSFSAAPDVVYTGFNQTSNNTVFPVTTRIPLSGVNVTHIRMDFFQDNIPNDPAFCVGVSW